MTKTVRWCVAWVLVSNVAQADDRLHHEPVIDGVLATDAADAPPDPDIVAMVWAQAEVAAPARDSEVPPVRTPAPELASLRERAPGVDHELTAHWVGQVGLRAGSSIIDGAAGGTVTELVVGGGLHLDRWTLLGEYGISLVHHDPSADGAAPLDVPTHGTTSAPEQATDGVMHRLGGAARYAFWRAKSAPELRDHDAQAVGEMYLQAGGGAEIIQWDRGGRLVRPDLSVAIGLLGAFRTSASRRHGWFMAVRLQVAPRIDLQDAASTCAAPCTAATPPVTWSDRSYMFETGFVFGS